MSEKKILIFNPKVTAGGITKIISDYINNFSNDLHVEIMTLKVENNIYIKDLKNQIHEIGLSKNIFFRIINEYKIIKNGEYDVVHINGDFASRILECLVAKVAGIKKIIIHSHNNGIDSKSRIKFVFQKYAKKLFDYLATDYLACSASAAEWMFSKKIISNKKYEIINNGIDIDLFKFNKEFRNELREEYNLNNKFVIGNVSRFSEQKNHEFLINLFNEFNNINPESCLLLIGTGDLENSIRNKVNELRLSNNVIFLGNRDDTYKFYNVMDAFVLPSKYEGLGIVNIEAQASGLPTVVSNNIPIEAKVSDLIKFVSLDESLEKWCKEIFRIESTDNRKNAYKKVKDVGFDIKDVAKRVENEIYN